MGLEVSFISKPYAIIILELGDTVPTLPDQSFSLVVGGIPVTQTNPIGGRFLNPKKFLLKASFLKVLLQGALQVK